MRAAHNAAGIVGALDGGIVYAAGYHRRDGGIRYESHYAALPVRAAHLAGVAAVLDPAVIRHIADDRADVVDGLHEGIVYADVLDAAVRVRPDVAEQAVEALLVLGEKHAVDGMVLPVEAALEGRVGGVVRVGADGRPLVCRAVIEIPARPVGGAVEPEIVVQNEVFAAVGGAFAHLVGEAGELRGGVDLIGIGGSAASPAVARGDAAVPYRLGSGAGGALRGLVFLGHFARPVALHGGVVIEHDGHEAAMRPAAVRQAGDDHAEGEAARLHDEGYAVLIEAADPADVAHLLQLGGIDEYRLADLPRAVDGIYLALGGTPVGVVHLGVDIGRHALLICEPRVQEALAVRGVGGAAPIVRHLVVLGLVHVGGIVIVEAAEYVGIARGDPDGAVKILPRGGAAAGGRKIEVRVGGDGIRVDPL